MADDTAQSIREALEPYVRTREEAAHIRRVLAAHLAAKLKSDDALATGSGSLALANVSWDVKPSTADNATGTGLQNAYLQALQANIEARRAFDEQLQLMKQRETETTEKKKDKPKKRADLLEDHLAAARLSRKKERLAVVQRYIDALQGKPAAAADFLQVDSVFASASRTLPAVPQAVVDGLAAEQAGTTPTAASALADMENLVAQLEKSLLRAQLLLRREEKRLAAAKTRANHHKSQTIPAEVKLQALGTSRDALIAWMETELGNASGGGGDEEGGAEGSGRRKSEGLRPRGPRTEEDIEADAATRELRQSLLGSEGSIQGGTGKNKVRLDEKLSQIRSTYDRYVEERRRLVQLTEGETEVQSVLANKPNLSPGESESNQASANPDAAADKARSDILLSPYLERLLTVAREQKAGLSHKAHFHVVLTRRLRDTLLALEHVADESQLLPQYPLAGSSKVRVRKGALGLQGGNNSNSSGGSSQEPINETVSQRVAAWTYAADSAKISTFEAVAEQMETGQTALEKAAASLREAEDLLGNRDKNKDRDSDKDKEKDQDDVWSVLHGELGVIQRGA